MRTVIAQILDDGEVVLTGSSPSVVGPGWEQILPLITMTSILGCEGHPFDPREPFRVTLITQPNVDYGPCRHCMGRGCRRIILSDGGILDGTRCLQCKGSGLAGP